MINPIKLFWTKSIKRQLILGIALVHAVLMTIFVNDLVSRQLQFLHNQSLSQAISLAQTLSVNSASWVIANDIVGLEELINAQSNFPDLLYAMIIRPDGHVLAHTNNQHIGMHIGDSLSQNMLNSKPMTLTLINNNNQIDIAVPIMINNDHIAWARIALSQESNIEGLNIITRDGIIYTILAIVVGVIFALLMSKSLTSGLVTLVEVANRIRKGEFSMRSDIDRNDEVGRLSDTFNLMLKTIEDKNKSLKDEILQRETAQKALSNANLELESRVNARTTELAEKNDKLTIALKTLEAAKEELVESEKLASLGSIVAGVAHELNTPLGIGVTAASYIEDTLDSFVKKIQSNQISRHDLDDFILNSKEIISLIVTNLNRASELVRSFKQVAVDQTSENRREFELDIYVNEVITTLKPKFKLTPHEVIISIPQGIKLDSYPGPFGQVISNSVLNSLIHGFDDNMHGVVSISASLVNENFVKITVSDNGSGIDKVHLKHVFEPFFTTKLGQGGSGLGMHVSYSIVTSVLGGKITIESVPGIETIVTIIIPIVATKNSVPFKNNTP